MLATTVWFPEPENGDDAWATDRETTYGWLARSIKPRACEVRRFLNENIAKLPLEDQPTIVHALGHRWQTAYFELIVIRLMQEWGAEIEIEVANEEGRRPDIQSRFLDGEIIVEATSPIYSAALGSQMAVKQPLLRIIEQLLPAGYCFGAWDIPAIGLSQSRKEFKRVVKEILAPYWEFSAEQIPIEGIELFAMFAGGELRLRLYPDRVFKSEKFRLENRTLFGPMASGAVDDVTPIKNAVRYKRKQVRASKSPVVLALHGGNMGAGLEDFDQALIGHSFEKIALVGDTTHRLGVGFTPDGELYRRLGSDKPPIYAGVLALRDVGFFGFKPPVFYPHPRFRGDLPEAITKLSSRILNFDTQEVEQRQAADEDEAMERMGFASHSV